MPLYKSKPELIEAVQWRTGEEHPALVFHPETNKPGVSFYGEFMSINDGDWIIKYLGSTLGFPFEVLDDYTFNTLYGLADQANQ